MMSKECRSNEHLLLVDGHALAFYCWYSTYPNSIVSGFIRELTSAINRYKPTHLIVCFDPPPPTFRHELYSEYKANRPPLPDGFLDECQRLYDALNSLSVQSYQVSGYEADDLLGTASELALNKGFRITIMTSDLDLLQLIKSEVNVEVFSPYWPTRVFDSTSAAARFGGVSPCKIPDYKALAGDRSDNLPGVRGIGDVSATYLLTNIGDLDSIYQNLDQVSLLSLRGAKRIAKLLENNQATAFQMRTLATIVIDVPVIIDLEAASCVQLQPKLSDWKNRKSLIGSHQ